MIEEIQVSVELKTEVKMRLDIYNKLNGTTQKEVISKLLDEFLPNYSIQVKED